MEHKTLPNQSNLHFRVRFAQYLVQRASMVRAAAIAAYVSMVLPVTQLLENVLVHLDIKVIGKLN